ncbi:MAG: RHS repeat-associated core domain-containing protein [Acidimicrobiia bacterium]
MSDPLQVVINGSTQAALLHVDLGAGLRFYADERSTSRRLRDYELRVALTGARPPSDITAVLVEADLPSGLVSAELAPKPHLVWQHYWDGQGPSPEAVNSANGAEMALTPTIGSSSIPVRVGWRRQPTRGRPEHTQWWQRDQIRGTWDARSVGFGGFVPYGLCHFEPSTQVLWHGAGQRSTQVDVVPGTKRSTIGLSWVPARDEHIVVATQAHVHVFGGNGYHLRSFNRVSTKETFRARYDDRWQLTGWTLPGDVQISCQIGAETVQIRSFTGAQYELVLDAHGRAASLKLIKNNEAAPALFEFGFNEHGLLENVTDPVGLEARVLHDQLGNATAVSWSSGYRVDTVITNDAGVRKISQLSGGGQESSVSRRSVNMKGTELRQHCCGSGSDTIITEAPGETITLQPNGTVVNVATETRSSSDGVTQIERVTHRTPGGRLKTTIRHKNTAAKGTITEVVDQHGSKWRRSFDPQRRAFTEESPNGLVTSAEFTEANQRRWTQPGLGVVEATYEQGRLVHQRAGTSEASFLYNEHGWVSAINHDGLKREFRYDSAGRLVDEFNGLGWLHYERDAAGRVVATTSPNGDQTQLELALDGLVLKRRRPTEIGIVTEEFTYNDDRILVSSQVEGEAALDYVRDQAGRVTKLSAGETETSFVWNPHSGQPQSAATHHGDSVAYVYDGYLLARHETTGRVNATIEFDYDQHFRECSVTVDGLIVNTERDAAGNILVRGPVRVVREAETDRVSSLLVGQLRTEYQYNSSGALVFHATYHGEQLIFAETITRDSAGQIVEVVETESASQQTIKYRYDQAKRLVGAWRDNSVLLGLNFDPNDNIVEYIRSDQHLTATIGAGDRLRTFDGLPVEHSPSGLVQRLGRRQFHYDGFGQLQRVDVDFSLPASASREHQGSKVDPTETAGEVNVEGVSHSVEYRRDAFGRPLEANDNGNLRYQLLWRGQRVAQVYYPNGRTLRTVHVDTATAPEVLFGGNELLRVISDHRGNVRRVIEATTGEVVQALDYDPLGDIVADSNPGFQPFGYAGALHDSVAQVVDLGARQLDLSSSRFLQPDPLDLAGGQSNLYVYAGNNPVNRHDPHGLQSSSQAPVQVCEATIMPTPGRSSWASVDHGYLKVNGHRRGMAGTGDWRDGLWVEWEEHGDEYADVESCRPIEDADPECLLNVTTPGGGLLFYAPNNICWDAVWEALDACSPDANWSFGETDETWPLARAHEGISNVSRTSRRYTRKAIDTILGWFD